MPISIWIGWSFSKKACHCPRCSAAFCIQYGLAATASLAPADGGTLYIELEIEDHLLPWNNRSFRLCFSEGKCMLADEPAEYKLKMEIGTLTTLLLGYKTAERLYALERIEGKQEAVDRLDDVLFHKIPYISDYI